MVAVSVMLSTWRVPRPVIVDVGRYSAWKSGFESLVGVGDNPGILKSPGERPARKQQAAPVGPPIVLRTSPLPPGAVEPPPGVKLADAEAAVQPYIAAKACLPHAEAHACLNKGLESHGRRPLTCGLKGSYLTVAIVL